jgi:hypothetical protein
LALFELFTVVFYGLRSFGCKSAQFRARQREDWIPEVPSFGNAAQSGENERKNSSLNYESPALTAELQARVDYTVKHSTPQRTNPDSIRGCSNR